MQFSNSFDVQLPPDAAWAFLMDIERIAPCMPGAELVEIVDPDTYKGKVSVRLGPVSLSFTGIARFEDRNDAERHARVKAQGSDSKGRGGANATVDFRLAANGAGSTVTVNTDLTLSGAVAQYGRGAGMIQSVATQLVNQFADALKDEIARMPAPAIPDASGDETARPAVATPATDPPAPRVVKPIGGFSLVFRAVWASILGLFPRRGA